MFKINRSPDAPPAGAPPATPPAGTPPASVQVNHQTPGAVTPPAYTPPAINMAEAIPPEFRDKPFFKDITFDKLIKDYVNAQELIGKRPSVLPPADAKPEQLEAFFAQLRPKAATDYTFPETDYMKKHGGDKEYQTHMRQVFHKAGLHPWQVEILSRGNDEYLTKFAEGRENKDALSEQEFDRALDAAYGADKQKSLETAKNLMIESVPAEMKPKIAGLSNDALLLLTMTLNAVHKKYIAEDSFPGGPGAGSGAGDEASIRKQATDLMASKAYNNFMDPQHEAVKKQVADLYTQIGQIHKARK
jgi:hypothetical protein